MEETYKNAFTEVYEILNYLDEESYNRIPKEIINAIEENRNKKYEYFLDESISFVEQEMLEETRAILFNIYRDYLTTPERKKKILEYQNQELKIIEQEKIKRYSSSDMFSKNKCNDKDSNSNKLPLVQDKKEKWYKKIINFLKKIWL